MVLKTQDFEKSQFCNFFLHLTLNLCSYLLDPIQNFIYKLSMLFWEDTHKKGIFFLSGQTTKKKEKNLIEKKITQPNTNYRNPFSFSYFTPTDH